MPLKTIAALALMASAMSLSAAASAAADDLKLNGHEIQTKFRLIYFDRDYENDVNDRSQAALATELNYKSPQFFDIFGIGLSGYGVGKLGASGAVREDILKREGDDVVSFAILGQFYLNITPVKGSSIKVGRELHKSMFLSSSTSRAVPNTFQGINAYYDPMKGLKLYGAIYNEWSPRASDLWERFSTDQSDEVDIQYVTVIGANYKTGPYTVQGEYLLSKDYLQKFGLRGTYWCELDQGQARSDGRFHADGRHLDRGQLCWRSWHQSLSH